MLDWSSYLKMNFQRTAQYYKTAYTDHYYAKVTSCHRYHSGPDNCMSTQLHWFYYYRAGQGKWCSTSHPAAKLEAIDRLTLLMKDVPEVINEN